MRLCVFGANGPTGRLVTRQALEAGHRVVAVTRHPEAFPLRHGALRVHAGDVTDPRAVREAIAGQDAVVSGLGVPFGFRPVTVYSAGVATILAAMEHAGVGRFVAVTSSAVDPGREATGGYFFRAVLQPLIVNTLGRTVYGDMRRMEALVAASAVDWVIVRPSGLFDREGVADYVVSDARAEGRFTARADLADLLVREAGPAAAQHRTVVYVASRGRHPGMLSLIWHEAISRKR